jgi:hypothetical protein
MAEGLLERFFIDALSAAMKKTSSSAVSVPRAKRAVNPYSLTYPHSKAWTTSLVGGLRY